MGVHTFVSFQSSASLGEVSDNHKGDQVASSVARGATEQAGHTGISVNIRQRTRMMGQISNSKRTRKRRHNERDVERPANTSSSARGSKRVLALTLLGAALSCTGVDGFDRAARSYSSTGGGGLFPMNDFCTGRTLRGLGEEAEVQSSDLRFRSRDDTSSTQALFHRLNRLIWKEERILSHDLSKGNHSERKIWKLAKGLAFEVGLAFVLPSAVVGFKGVKILSSVAPPTMRKILLTLTPRTRSLLLSGQRFFVRGGSTFGRRRHHPLNRRLFNAMLKRILGRRVSSQHHHRLLPRTRVRQIMVRLFRKRERQLSVVSDFADVSCIDCNNGAEG